MTKRSGSLLRLATYNVDACVGADGQRRPGRTLAVLAKLDADLIAIQEVDSRHHGPPIGHRGWRWHRGHPVRSFPASWPLLSLDRIAVSPPGRLRRVEAHRGRLPGSRQITYH